MKITAILALLCLILAYCWGRHIASAENKPPAPQETILTIEEITAFERNTGKPYWIITNRVLKRKLKYEVERILND